MASDTILVLGSGGQIGTELLTALRKNYGNQSVIASDIKEGIDASGPYEVINVLDKDRIFEVVQKYKVTQVYLLAAMLSATAEKFPEKGWQLNMESLFHVLNLAKEKHIQQVYWPSSIAAFGPTTPKSDTPQHTITEPSTVYGISKLAGELWCEWYFKKHGVDVRSLRYPGLISYTAPPGGGTTDYAVDIFHQALKNKTYECFLSAGTRLPMMYMPDAIRATIEIMQAPAQNIQLRSGYNLAAFSFTPAEIAHEIRQRIPDFQVTYQPDFRQAIADSWPQSIDDSAARKDWNWKPAYTLHQMVEDMLTNLQHLTQNK
jgi:nucleoside-diphosphate-sugar epimerase